MVIDQVGDFVGVGILSEGKIVVEGTAAGVNIVVDKMIQEGQNRPGVEGMTVSKKPQVD